MLQNIPNNSLTHAIYGLCKDWTKEGVLLINNLLDEGGNLMTFDHFKNVYNINTNFTYQGLISPLKKVFKRMKHMSQGLREKNGPVLPSNVKFVLNPREVQKTCTIF